jgi:Trp operon repressor
MKGTTKMIQLHGLNKDQREIANMLCDCDSVEEVEFLMKYMLTDNDRRTACTILEIIEQEMAEEDIDITDLHVIQYQVADLFMRCRP